MSVRPPQPVTVPDFLRAKQAGRKLSMLTAYEYLWAALFDEAGVDAILVGDTLGMVVQGKPTTLPVTLDEMIYHGEIVARAVKRALVVVDLPFLSFQASPRQAVENAGRVLKETQAAAVKLEGGRNQARTIERLNDADIPVMAHVGMKPQSVRKLGRMAKVQRDEEQLLADAHAAEQAGAFAIVLELIPQSIARRITEELKIPTIGIGAGPHCDGQVLVSHDMLGLTPGFHPRFLKKYADLHHLARTAVQQYVTEVQEGAFPDNAHSHD
jgi:3-methyl-2-oxobutanoate hydroxymethyltransferase